MLRSRRGFLEVLSSGGTGLMTAEWLAARGLEDYLAQAAQPAQPGQAPRSRPELPPGVKEIRISSNENPLGPGKTAIDAIVRKFPEAGRYPFNSTPSDSNLVGAIAGESSVDGRSIGAIEVSDRFSIVEVPDENAQEVIAALRASTIKGKKATVRRDRTAPPRANKRR